MGQARCQTANSIKDQITQRAESILDVVTENIEGPHVADQMPEPSMEKHKGKKRKNLLESCKISADLGNGIAGRDETIDVDKSLQTDLLSELVKENDNIESDDGDVDNRVIFSWYGIAQGDHCIRCKLWDRVYAYGQ